MEEEQKIGRCDGCGLIDHHLVGGLCAQCRDGGGGVTPNWRSQLAALAKIGRQYRHQMRMSGKRVDGKIVYRAALERGMPGGRIINTRRDQAGNVCVEVIRWS